MLTVVVTMEHFLLILAKLNEMEIIIEEETDDRGKKESAHQVS